MDSTQAAGAPKLTITVPIFNEKDNIQPLHEKVCAAMAVLAQP